MIDMWEKIFTEDTLKEIIRILGKDNATEDMDTLKDMVEYLSANYHYGLILSYLDEWVEYTTIEQVAFAVSEVGEEYASRFMIILDYLIMLENKKEQAN